MTRRRCTFTNKVQEKHPCFRKGRNDYKAECLVCILGTYISVVHTVSRHCNVTSRNFLCVAIGVTKGGTGGPSPPIEMPSMTKSLLFLQFLLASLRARVHAYNSN